MFFLTAILFHSHIAFAIPASDDSIHRLLEITNAAQVADAMSNQIAGMRNQIREAALKDHPPSAQAEAFTKDLDAVIGKFRKEQLQFKNFEPDIIKIYRESFSDEEINDLVRFYGTSTGQKIVKSMPTIMAQIVQAVQARVKDRMPELMNQIKALGAKHFPKKN